MSTRRVRSGFIRAVLRKGQEGASNGETALNNSNLNKTKEKEKGKERKTRYRSSFKYKYTYKNLTQVIYNHKSVQSRYQSVRAREVCPYPLFGSWALESVCPQGRKLLQEPCC